MSANARIWHLVLVLLIFSTPLIIMYAFQILESVARPR